MKYKLQTKNTNVYYGKLKALNNINIDIHANAVTALIGHTDVENQLFYVYLIE